MLRKFIATTILDILGWKILSYDKEQPPSSSVICIAPHTSNWDFILGKLYNWKQNNSSYFLIKKEWFVFPFNLILSSMGGIPVNRGKKASTVEKIHKLISKGRNVRIAITPEGTRKRCEKWHNGFYYIALEANIPIEIAVIDYKNKEMGIVGLLHPCGDIDKDLEYIKSFYTNTQAKYPKQFTK